KRSIFGFAGKSPPENFSGGGSGGGGGWPAAGGGWPVGVDSGERREVIWDEEEEYPFVNEYPSFKEEPIMFVEDESCLVYNTDNAEDVKPAPKYDFDSDELVFEDEEVCLLDVGNSILGSSKPRSHYFGHSSNNYNSKKRATTYHAECKSSVERPEPDHKKEVS
nr:hypothetical protein [Tanacetum cinerariifolium]